MVMAMKQPGPSVIQTDDAGKVLDPVQGQILVNHKGIHETANPTVDPVVYYHDGELKKFSGAAGKAFSYVVTFNGEVMGSGSWQFINDVNWDESYTNASAEVVRTGEAAGIFSPQIDDGQILINPGVGNGMVCAITVQAGFNFGGGTQFVSGADHEIGVGCEVGATLASPVTATNIAHNEEVLNDNNGALIYTTIETFVATGTAWARPIIFQNSGGSKADAFYYARIEIVELDTFVIADGTFGP